MPRSLRKLTPLSLLAVAILVVGCDQPSNTTSPEPAAPQAILGGLLGGETLEGYELVKDPLLTGLADLQVSKLVGVEGGELKLLGHTLQVPAGAVTSPTLFSLLVLPTGYVEVELTATVKTLFGLLDLGGKGFRKPVPVTLTYSRSTNVADPADLVVVRVNSLVGYGALEPLPSTVDLNAKTVTAKLDHFSRYALASPF